jgi:hypothetical protein
MSHQERISAQQAGFTAAVSDLERAVEQLDEAVATRTPDEGGWSAAQIAWHVGETNELLAAVLSGDAPMATPAPEGFTENPAVFSGVPAKVQTFPQLMPPDGVTRADGLAKLRGSVPPYLGVLQGLAPERAAGFCVDFPFGKLSLYQIADFAAAHVTRHLQQVQRASAGV